jgi:hypothetical protein
MIGVDRGGNTNMAWSVTPTLACASPVHHRHSIWWCLMYGARELAFRADEETRSGGDDLLMRSPFDEVQGPSASAERPHS